MNDENLKESISYIEQDGEWKNRKINLVSVLKNFVSQLKPGQDMTKFSIPAEICYPYGFLELIGQRELSKFHLLFEINLAPSPVERFFAVLKYFFGTVKSEMLHKKPLNPILGETHVIYADHPSKNVNAYSVFVGEQVSHHPPVSAVFLNSSVEQIKLNSNVGFEIKFGGNYVNVKTAGSMVISADRFHETYKLSKCFPDMLIKNVVWGKKYIMWDGEVLICCQNTGLRAYVRYTEKNKVNYVNAFLLANNKEEPLYEFGGVAGGQIFYGPPGYKNKELFVDLGAVSDSQIHYLPISKLTPNSSYMIWNKMNLALVSNDVAAADIEKKLVEDAQRDKSRTPEGSGSSTLGAKYFVLDQLTREWNFDESLNLNEIMGFDTLRDDSKDKEANDVKVMFEENDEAAASLLVSSNNNNNQQEASSPNEVTVVSDSVKDIAAVAEEYTNDSNLPRSSFYTPTSSEKKSKAKSAPHNGSGSGVGEDTKRDLRAVKKKAREEQKQLLKQVRVKRKQNEQSSHEVLETGEIIKGYVKVRNSFKKWRERWIVLQHGRLIYYKKPEDVQKLSCSSLVNLIGCDVWWRPTKKHGSCFKIYSLNQYPIFNKTGLKGENLSTAFLPLSTDHVIMRVESKELAKNWIEQIRMAIPDWKQNETLILAARMHESGSESEYEDSDDVYRSSRPRHIENSGDSNSANANGNNDTQTANDDDEEDEDDIKNLDNHEILLKMIRYLKKITAIERKTSHNTGRQFVSTIDLLDKIYAHLSTKQESFTNPFERNASSHDVFALPLPITVYKSYYIAFVVVLILITYYYCF